MSDPSPSPTSQGRSSLRVGFDATSLLDRPTGVGTFSREVLTGLAAMGEVDVTAFAVSLRGGRRLGSVAPVGATVANRPVPARLARTLWRRGLRRPSARDLAGPVDVVHGPNFVVPPGGGAVEVVTIHDLTALHYPEMCTRDVLQWPGLLRLALARGAWVHAVSGHVAGEVRDAFPEAGDRVVAVPNGHRSPPEPSPVSDSARGRYLAGGDRYVLAVGTVEPRKDLALLVKAFDRVAAEDRTLRLVIAGPDGWGAAALTDAIDRCAHRRRVVRLGWVADDDRWGLVRGASLVVYPSRYEGFGLVPLDAMSVGTPVVATAAGAVPEVVGEGAFLVPVGDVDALAGAIASVLTDTMLRDRLIAAGRIRAASFDWGRTVDAIHDLYRHAVVQR